MPYSIGDILLKIDVRATSNTKHSCHHVMLVVGESKAGFPIVMHMLGAPHFKLVKEELTRGKDLGKIHYLWPEPTQLIIVQAAEGALKTNQFVINEEILDSQCNAVSPYRPMALYEEATKLAQLRKKFTTDSNKDLFTPTPNAITLMSCHEWVIKIIHFACRQTKIDIPLGLQIPPALAWADRLFSSVKSDPRITYSIMALPGLATITQTSAGSTSKPVTKPSAASAASASLLAVNSATIKQWMPEASKALVNQMGVYCTFFQALLNPEPNKKEKLTQQNCPESSGLS